MLLFSVLILFFFGSGVISENPCGDWEPYKNERCLKILNTTQLLNYTNAENECKQLGDSHLLTIETEEKQKFVEEFLERNQISDNVWLGLKYVNDAYRWADGFSQFQFENWKSESPKRKAKFCIQMHTDESYRYSWSDQQCKKRNLVICEIMQPWPLIQLQKVVMTLITEPILPIGFIYVQLPNQTAPNEKWSWMEWEDVTSEYAGLFFRAEGENAAPFGEVQEADSPKLVAMDSVETDNGVNNFLTIDRSTNRNWDMQVMMAYNEVRPRNMAIKIWKRTK